jgi:hypothetical protein|tara:strand:- start:1076 stop:1483 length:408 start_codon:yes stop_codon:yes gene_type:complete
MLKVYTLIDITETKSYRSADQKLNHQQANFMTFIQTLMLTMNFFYDKAPTLIECDEKKLKELGFGSDYKGSHNVWCLEARVDEGRQVPDVETLQNDFDLVPVIPNLNETILINNNVFRAKDKKARNITFNKANIT